MVLQSGIVKYVLSGDTIILKGKAARNGPPPERTLGLAFIQAPRMGNFKKDISDEPFAFESKEYLRKLLVGKEVNFSVEYSVQNTGREFGIVYLPDNSTVNQLMVKVGFAKARVQKHESSEEPDWRSGLQDLEVSAQQDSLGMWSEAEPAVVKNGITSEEANSLLVKWQGKLLDGIVDQVITGSSLRVILNLQDGTYQSVAIHLSGIRCPPTKRDTQNDTQTTPEELIGEEAKFFVESRFLQRDIKVDLQGLAGSSGSIFFNATVLHPSGNKITNALLMMGLAKIFDKSLQGIHGGMTTITELREAEKVAKSKHLRLWKDFVQKDKNLGSEPSFIGTVKKIITADSFLVVSESTGEEYKISLASLKTPKFKDEKESGFNFEAKEVLRKRLIGNKVKVEVDYIKPPADNFPEERICSTVLLNNLDVSLSLISKGLATVVRHRRDDEDRSRNYDQLLEAESKAIENQKGMHSNKEPPTYRFNDISESSTKARQFLPFLQRSGRIQAVVEHVANGSRFRIYIPKDATRCTLVLEGIRAPRLARNANEKSEPFGVESHNFSSNLAMQRDVEIEISNVDKVGGFIGSLFVPYGRTGGGKPKLENLACLLLENGLAYVHEYSASQSKYSRDFTTSEEKAKEKSLNVWSIVVETKEEEVPEEKFSFADKRKDVEVVVCEVSQDGTLWVQIVGNEVKKLEKLMAEFSIHHSHSNDSVEVTSVPRVGDHISAKFSEDNQWYRAKVLRVMPGKKSFEVLFGDYGNSEEVPLRNIRPLPAKFNSLPFQACHCKLAWVKMPSSEEEFGLDALSCLRQHCHTEGSLPATLYPGGKGQTSNIIVYLDKDRKISLNQEIVAQGLASVEKATRLNDFEAEFHGKLGAAESFARKNHYNLWQYGDFTADNDFEFGA